MSTSPHAPFYRATLTIVIAMAWLSLMTALTGCTTVRVGQRSTAEAISQQRTTILTGSQLSTASQGRLLQAGLDSNRCLQNMPLCLLLLKRASLDDDKGLYGTYSELFYAAALQRNQGLQCTTVQKELATPFAKQLTTPVTSPNKPVMSDPSSDTPANHQSDEQKTTNRNLVSCLKAYQDDMLQAARFAYIYLLYDNLAKPASIQDDKFASLLQMRFAQARDLTTKVTDDTSTKSMVLSASAPAVTQIPATPLAKPTADHATKTAKTNSPLVRAKGIDQGTRPQSAVSQLVAPPTQPDTLKYPPNERDIQVQDIYYAAIDALGNELFEKKLEPAYQINSNKLIVTMNGQGYQQDIPAVKLISSYQINLSRLNSISRRDGFGMNYVAVMDDRYTTSLRNQIRNHTMGNLSIDERIHALGHLPVTALLMPKGDDLASLLTTNQFSLDLYDPYRYNNIPFQNKKFALSANFSAPYGLWLHENTLEPVSLVNLFSSKYQNSQPHLFMLEPYNPNKRVIIMLHGLGSSPDTWIGLTNDIFNDAKLRDNYQVWQVFYPTNMPILENRYQINELLRAAFAKVDPRGNQAASQHAVIIGHSMGGVISRMLVSNTNLIPALASMLKNDNPNVSDATVAQVAKQLNADNGINDRLILHALPQVDRAVFISSPFRGTYYADKWFTRSLRRVIALPKTLVQHISTNINDLFVDNPAANRLLRGLFLENGASQLSDRSVFVKLTQNVIMKDNIKVNTLIASDNKQLYNSLMSTSSASTASSTESTNISSPPLATADNNVLPNVDTNNLSDNTKAVLPQGATEQPMTASAQATDTRPLAPSGNLYNQGNLEKAEQKIQANQRLLDSASENGSEMISDGIVPYSSAHLDNVETEKLLPGRHNIHASPQAILELRRILHRQLRLYGLPSEQDPKLPDRQP